MPIGPVELHLLAGNLFRTTMTIFTALISIALLAVLGVLITGIVSMFRGGEFNEKYGNRLMRWRVILQFAAIIIMMGALFLASR